MSSRSRPPIALLTALVWLLGLGLATSATAYPQPAGSAFRPDAGLTGEDDPFDRWLSGAIQLLLTEEEAVIAAELASPEQQAVFRQWFWARRDPRPATARNEFRDAFFDRLSVAEKEFGDPKGGRPGWKTVAGAMYVLLGPPETVRHYPHAVVVDGGFRALQTWVYPHSATGTGELQIVLVELPGGLILLGDERTESTRRRLREALQAAVRGSIGSPGLGFESTVMVADALDPLPLEGRIRLDEGTLDGDLSLPIAGLYGRRRGSALTIELRLSVRLSPHDPRAAGSHPPEQQLGSVVVELSADELQDDFARNLKVAVWLSAVPLAGSNSGELVVTEVPTGRQVAIPFDARAVEVPDRYAVDRNLSVAVLAAGDGIAVAFLEAAMPTATPDAVALWLARRAARLEGERLPMPSGGLRLLRVSPPAQPQLR